MDLQPRITQKYELGIIMLLAFAYLIAPLITFLHEAYGITFSFLDLQYPSAFFASVKYVERNQFAAFSLIIAFLWIGHIAINSNKQRFKLQPSAGALGVFTSLLSLLGLVLFKDSILVVLFGISGLICIYCISIPTSRWVYHCYKDKKWESIFLFVATAVVIYYFVSGYSAIKINEMYSIDAEYFSYTTPVVSFLLLTPYITLSAFVLLLIVLVKEFYFKSDSQSSFNNLNKMMTCYILMAISLALGSREAQVVELVSSNFDFSPTSPCFFNKHYDGYIMLDAAHTKVLIYSKDDTRPYRVRNCNTF